MKYELTFEELQALDFPRSAPTELLERLIQANIEEENYEACVVMQAELDSRK